MQIISHRGFWKNESEKNKAISFERSFSAGFGTETDLRDLDGELVISHDTPKSHKSILTFEKLLKIYCYSKCDGVLALNIKADGLQQKIKTLITKYNVDNYVLFDMSVPDQVATMRIGLKFLTRISDLEPYPCLVDSASGFWVDEFSDGWLTTKILEDIIRLGKPAFVVSPELHDRPHLNRWKMLKQYIDSDLILCTDYPEHAKEYFGV